MKQEAATVVVGAGPAGLMAALAAAEHGSRVVVCEQLDRVGARLLATGGGHCNLSNTLPESEFMGRFGRRGRFMHPALKRLGQHGLRGYLAELGVPTHSPDGFKVFPASNSSKTVQEALLRKCRREGVEIRTGLCAIGLLARDGVVRGVETGEGAIPASAVVLASGGKSCRELGGTGAGYTMAERAGHSVVRPLPALVPLVVAEAWVRQVAGVSLPSVRIWIDLPKRSRQGVCGELLFTHRGLSGPAVLDLSGDVAELLEQHAPVPLCLNLLSQVSGAEWDGEFDRWHEMEGRKRIVNLLDWRLPSSLAKVLCELAEVPDETSAAMVTRHQRQRLLGRLGRLGLTVLQTEGFQNAMVTRGGIALNQVNPDTLESRVVGGLHFAGEILDLDGPTGGFNLQWAFSSGFLAGSSATERS